MAKVVSINKILEKREEVVNAVGQLQQAVTTLESQLENARMQLNANVGALEVLNSLLPEEELEKLRQQQPQQQVAAREVSAVPTATEEAEEEIEEEEEEEPKPTPKRKARKKKSKPDEEVVEVEEIDL